MDFILKVTLRDTFNPAITRTLSVPAETTFLTLHHALQIAFDWDSSHLYAFRFETPTKYSQTLLEIVDAVSAEHGMGFNEQRVDAQVSLGDILADPTFAGVNYVNKLVYEYDFGDSWEHLVKIQGRTEPKAHIVCTAGTGRAAIDDCGGAPGWELGRPQGGVCG